MANTDRLELSNDIGGTKPRIHYISYGQDGNITATTALGVFTAPQAGRISGSHLSCKTYPTTNDRTLSVDLQKVSGANAAVSVFSTVPAFAATAGGSGQKSTDVGGTGITAGVLKTDGTATLAAGDTVVLVAAAAGSNGTIGTGLTFTFEFIPFATPSNG